LASYLPHYLTTASLVQSQSGINTIGVLIDVLEGLERNGREVAKYADWLKVAGQTCEKAYDVTF
jgi:hypothetical protein